MYLHVVISACVPKYYRKLGLESKVLIVCGAAHRIGTAIAVTFAAERADVAISDVDRTLANFVAEEARALGCQAVAIKADVSKADDVERMVGDTFQMFRRLNILVNNAGVFISKGSHWCASCSISPRQLIGRGSESDIL